MKSLFLIFILAGSVAYAQQLTTSVKQVASVEERWQVEGKVLDKMNKELVDAKIVYESLPYGGNMGFYNGHTFSFLVPKETEYRLKVTAEGYSPYFHEIKLDEFQNGVYSTTIELTPNDITRLIRLDKLIFEQAKADITQQSYAELNTIVAMMEQNPDMVIQLEGHTDFRGNAKQNMLLSERRVEAVKNYLVSKGIGKKRIRTKAFGGTQPLSREDNADAHEKNRRVEVRIISN